MLKPTLVLDTFETLEVSFLEVLHARGAMAGAFGPNFSLNRRRWQLWRSSILARKWTPALKNLCYCNIGKQINCARLSSTGTTPFRRALAWKQSLLAQVLWLWSFNWTNSKILGFLYGSVWVSARGLIEGNYRWFLYFASLPSLGSGSKGDPTNSEWGTLVREDMALL